MQKYLFFLYSNLDTTKVITNETFVKELSNLEEMSESSLKDLEKKASFAANRPIKIKFDPKISTVISQICQISYEESTISLEFM